MTLQATLPARRRAGAIVKDDTAVHKLFTELAERYKHRQGGYTRVLQTRQRSNDAAQMAFIECAFTQLHCFNGCWLQCRPVRAACWLDLHRP